MDTKTKNKVGRPPSSDSSRRVTVVVKNEMKAYIEKMSAANNTSVQEVLLSLTQESFEQIIKDESFSGISPKPIRHTSDLDFIPSKKKEVRRTKDISKYRISH